MNIFYLITPAFLIIYIIMATFVMESRSGYINGLTIRMPMVAKNEPYLDLCYEYAIMFIDGDYDSIHYLNGYCYGKLE